MWTCKKCSKPVFFAERKQSLGYDWHPNCLRCEECGKRLNPGQHAEHKGVPFCHHPCYGALFGPQLFGHGTRNECHTSFGRVENRDGQIKRSHMESQLRVYNSFYEGKPGELKSREVNGGVVLEGVLRVYWGVQRAIHLIEDDTEANLQASDSEDDDPLWRDDTTPPADSAPLDSTTNNNDCEDAVTNGTNNANNNSNGVKNSALGRRRRSAAIRRRPARMMHNKAKLKRRCSINGHVYARETSSFTPPFGAVCSLWVTSKTTTADVLSSLLHKYKVEMSVTSFALFVRKDNGELRRLRDDESPLVTRVMLGPHEDVAKVFVMDASRTSEISPQVAEFIHLSLVECRAILWQYEQEENRFLKDICNKYDTMRCIMQRRLADADEADAPLLIDFTKP